MGGRIAQGRAPTRVFLKTIDGSDRLWAAIRSRRFVRIWMGERWPDFQRGPTEKKSYASEAEAVAGFDELCAERRRQRWVEIRYLVEEGRCEPEISWLPYMLAADLEATALAKAAETKPVPKKAAESREGVLSRIVGARGTVIVNRRAARLSKKKLEGRLVLPTGSLVAVDPMHLDMNDVAPFTRAIPPGSYDVELAFAAGRVCAATIVVRRKRPERWELAIPRGKGSTVPASRRRVFTTPACGYPVDAGLGSFMDARALALLQEEDEHELDLHPRGATSRTHPVGKGGTVAVFTTGFGDGTYGTYFGLVGKEIVCVTTDFLVGA